MAIATKQVASGILGAAIPINYPGVGYMPISNSSDWFESFVAEPETATLLSVAVSVEAVTIGGTPTGNEILTLALLESGDLKDWAFVSTLTLTPAPATMAPGLYYATHSFGSSNKKYFRLEFHVDDPSLVGTTQTLAQPAAQIQFDGTCWVTVA
jgi:hypothetical protein